MNGHEDHIFTATCAFCGEKYKTGFLALADRQVCAKGGCQAAAGREEMRGFDDG